MEYQRVPMITVQIHDKMSTKQSVDKVTAKSFGNIGEKGLQWAIHILCAA